MSEKKLYEELIEYSKSDFYPFHMPGHKRNVTDKGEDDFEKISPYRYDITEIDGFDNLNNPEGIIKERMEKVSKFYNSKKSYYLVNGSTSGILTAISAAVHNHKNKNKILVARNCHKAVYNSILINNCEAIYINPGYIKEYGINGGIYCEDVKAILEENNDLCAVFITSPTYEGVVSDIKSIAEICHLYKIPLIVDEAHGAHFSMHKDFPKSALQLGADIVIQSLHKTLPSLTQTAILHIGEGAYINVEEIERYMRIYQTSSPSYVLMGSIDRCLDELMNNGNDSFEKLSLLINEFKDKCKKLTNIKLLDKDIVGKNAVYDFDKSKLVIYPISNLYSGSELYNKLYKKYHLQMEMTSLEYVLAMTSVNDTKEGFDRLFSALEEIDREIRVYEKPAKFKRSILDENNIAPIVCEKISSAVYGDNEEVFFDMAEGKISGEFVYLYPPGVPIILPGEMFTREIVEHLKKCIEAGISIVGMKNGMVKVHKESWSPLSLTEVKLKGNI